MKRKTKKDVLRGEIKTQSLEECHGVSRDIFFVLKIKIFFLKFQKGSQGLERIGSGVMRGFVGKTGTRIPSFVMRASVVLWFDII